MALILAVEDEPRIRRAVTRALSRAGHEVVAVKDAESAIARLLAERPDLFLLDLNLPGMDGISLARKLAAQKGTKEVPVIILSGRTAARDKVAAFASGALTYIEKPFKPADLVDAVRSALEIAARRRKC